MTFINEIEMLIHRAEKKSIPNWKYGKNDVTNVISNWFILHGYTNKVTYDYNAKVLLCAFEILRDKEKLSVESFRFIIENLTDVDVDADIMLEKSKTLYNKFCGIVDGDVVLVEDFVKELFS